MADWKLVAVGGVMSLLGMAVGAQLFGAQPAVAQIGGWRECFMGRQETVDIDLHGIVTSPDHAHNIFVPSGYTVVSGVGGDRDVGVVLFCR